MKSHYRAVVIGGGVVGVSVLYHLTRFGWSDVALIERAELTAGSTWHAAAGCHMINDDPNIAALQGYTIRLYKEIEAESGQSVGMHMTGGLNLAGNAARWEWLKAEQALFQTLGVEAHLVSAKEIADLCPIVDVKNVTGGLYDPNEGHLDPHGVTHAYAGSAKKRGAEVILHNRVTALTQRPDGSWDIETEKGKITAEHVVNAGGLWARKLGRVVGVNLPVVPMQHHYLITEDVPEIAALDKELPAVTDLEGFTYLRQERKGVLLGIYETNPSHWQVEGAAWDFGMDLLPPDIDRISPELTFAFERFPFLQKTGIRRWVNGAFTFTPDGNPLVGPVPGVKNYWVACGCMGGFSQGGAIGLSLAQWMIEGDPGADIFGMDVARYGDFAANDKYLTDMTRQFYARRFVLAYPNEELPAGRPLKTAPTYDRLRAEGAHFAPLWGMESPLYFAPGQPDFVETPSLRRSNAHDLVGQEVMAVRSAAGIFETSVYARYEVTGSGAEPWLNSLLAGKLPNLGKVRLAPMLSPKGKLLGDLSVTRVAEDRFWIVGSYHLQVFHQRWFKDHLPANGVEIKNLSDRWMGYAISGPKARDILAQLSPDGAALGFLSCGFYEVGSTTALVTRLSYSGELGFEINVPSENLWSLYDQLRQVGADYGLKPYGLRALDCLRLEKSYGGWGTEFAQSYTPGMSGLDRFIAFDKGAFIGRDAALRERDKPGDETLVTLEIEAKDADAFGYEPVFLGAERVGYITSGAYGHFVKKSLAFAYLKRSAASPGTGLEVAIIGERRAARVLAEAAYDPRGLKLRG